MVVLLVILTIKVLKVDLRDIPLTVIQEIKSLIGRERSIGAYNMFGTIVGVFFGFIIIAAIETDKVIRVLVQLVGREQVLVFEKAASFETMFYVVSGFLYFSILVVFLDKWRRK